jgi:putative phage-type endonuclease
MSNEYAVGSDAWNAAISPSKIAAYLGLSPWVSPVEQWYRSHGMLEPQPTNVSMQRGTHLEAGIISWWFAQNPQFGHVGHEVTFQREDLPGWIATPDDDATDEDGTPFGVECKSVRDDKEWGPPGTDQVPAYYYVQVMAQMHVSGRRKTAVIKHGPFVDQLDTYWVEYDPAMGAAIQERVTAIHNSPEPPANDGTASTYNAIRKVHADIDRDEDWQIAPALGIELEEARQGFAAAEERLNLAKSDTLRAMGRARRAMVGDVVIGQRQPTKSGAALYPPRKPVDLDALRAQLTPATAAA